MPTRRLWSTIAVTLLIIACGSDKTQSTADRKDGSTLNPDGADSSLSSAGSRGVSGNGATSGYHGEDSGDSRVDRNDGASTSGGVRETDANGSGGNGSDATTERDWNLAHQYPGDIGIEDDSNVVWTENFEEDSIDAFFSRYDDSKRDGLILDSDVPTGSSGHTSGKLTASGSGPNAVDFYKNLSPGFDELFIRYYVKYGAGAQWHHSGVWIGGYLPATNWPNPQAGLKPNGNDRFSVSFEPVEPSPNPRMDFYNYWMKMRSWMDSPIGDTAYYGNTLIHQASLKAIDDTWMCVEIHIKLNPQPLSATGAALDLWVDDVSVVQFSDETPTGCWIKDKFCTQSAPVADDPSCTDYPNLCQQPYVPLDLQLRNSSDLKLNAFWPQNYITDGGSGSVWYDDIVIARVCIGCIQK